MSKRKTRPEDSTSPHKDLAILAIGHLEMAAGYLDRVTKVDDPTALVLFSDSVDMIEDAGTEALALACAVREALVLHNVVRLEMEMEP